MGGIFGYFYAHQEETLELNQAQVDLRLRHLKGHIEIYKEKKLTQIKSYEKNLVLCVQGSARLKLEEYKLFMRIVQDYNELEACDVLLKYFQIVCLKSKPVIELLCQSQGDTGKVHELMPHIYSILWCQGKLQIENLNEFCELIMKYFGKTLIQPVPEQVIDPKLLPLFHLPDASQINQYALLFSQKSSISMAQINSGGHQFQDPSQQMQSQQYQYPPDSLGTQLIHQDDELPQQIQQHQIQPGQNPYAQIGLSLKQQEYQT